MHVENITSNAMSLDRNGHSMLIQVYEKEINRLNNIINGLEKGVNEAIKQLESLKYIDKYRFTYDREFQKAIDKLKALKEE